VEHLDEDTLSQLAGGSLEAGAAKHVADHLATCKPCTARFEALSAVLFSTTFAAPISNTPAPKGLPETNPDGPDARAQATQVRLLHKGTSLGRYVLLEKLGAGGMGEVFAAYDPHLDRKVALKLLRAGSLSADEGKARLVREAQAMARLQHPNVAAVHDVGTFDERVFVAMEFIEGETLSEWLRAPRKWAEVVRLFLQAGSGLSAAHKAGIIHRDFKPDNVLIGSDGRPRVVDFGLARQTATPISSGRAASDPDARPRPMVDGPVDGTLGSPITRDGAVMGTPGYMAPEQLNGLPTDARSDQFAFCVALYEALYGKRPFGGTTLKAHAAEIVAGKLAPIPDDTEVPSYVHDVVIKGLSADPANRFESLDALIAVLRPKGAITTNRRVLVGVAALAALALAAIGYGALARQRLQVCSGSERRLTNVWDVPTRDKLRAGFLATNAPFAADAWKGVESTLDGYAKGWVSAAGEACEAARLHKTDTEDDYQLKVVCLETRLQHLKTITHLLDGADRDVVIHSQDLVRGLEPVDACLDVVALNQHVHPANEKGHEKEEALRQGLFEARALHDAGKYTRGIEVLKAAMKDAEGAPPGPMAEAQLLLGRLHIRAGQAKEAEAMLFSAVLSAEGAGEASLTARAFSRLAMAVGSSASRAEQAHTWQRLAQAAAARVANDKEVEAELSSNSGLIAVTENDFPRAKDEFQNALTLQEQTLGEDNPEVARTLNNLGTALARHGDLKEATIAYERSYLLHVKNVGTEHPDTANSMSNLAVMYRRQGRLSESLSYFERSLAVRRNTLGDEHPDTAASFVSLANLQIRMGQPEPALENLMRALAIRKKAFGPDDPQVAAVFDDLSAFYLARRSGKEALENAQLAIAIDEKALGPGATATAAAHDKAGHALMLLGQWDKAQAELTQALEARKSKLGPDHPEVASAYNSMGDLYLAQGKGQPALAQYEKALELRRKVSTSEDNPTLAYDLLGIGRAQLMLKQPQAAVEPLSHALKLRETSEDATEVAAVRFELARALWDAKPDERERAASLAAQAQSAVPPDRQGEVTKWLAAHVPPDAGVRL
jgi:tetratricopeptide (TPR) repeat protein/predicted Ser/Thr protein kinase